MAEKTLVSLFEQTKDLKRIGPRLSGDAEVVHDIEDQFRAGTEGINSWPVTRKQIQKILEFVPSIFPENWKSPWSYKDMTPEQQEAYAKIYNGIAVCPGPVIQRVIELAVGYREKYKPKENLG